MLTKQLRGTLPATLTVNGQGESVVLPLTYHNRRQTELNKFIETTRDSREIVLYLVESWESEYDLSLDGLAALEDDRPGMILALIEGFHQARKVEAGKNSVRR